MTQSRLFQMMSIFSIGSVILLSGCNDDDEDPIDPPVAGFTFTVNGASVTFVNTSIGVGNAYSWDFDDGRVADLESPTITFTTAGTYTVTLTAMNEGGSDTFSDEVTLELTVTNPACVAETAQSVSAADLNITFLTDPEDDITVTSDNAGYERIENPDFENQVNSSCFVAQISRDGASLFSNNQFTLDGKLNFNGNGGFKIKVWSATTGTTVTIKLEDQTNAGINTEQTVILSKTSEWEELNFTFENADDTYDKIVLFLDLNTNNTATYFFDDLAIFQGDGTGGNEPIPPTTVASAPTENPDDVISIYSDSYMNVANEGLNRYGAATFVEVDFSGNGVLQYTQSDAEGGNFQIIELGGTNQIDASEMTNFRFDAWFSNEIGTGASLILKIVNLDGSDPIEEAVITITTASSPMLTQGQWLSYDFTLSELESLGLSAKANIQQIVVDVINVGEVYLDNLYFYNDNSGSEGNESTDGELADNGDFETGDLTGWAAFDNGGSIIADNAISNGGSWSGKIEALGSTSAGSNPVLKQERKGGGLFAAEDQIQIKFDYRGTLAGAGGVFDFQAFIEASSGVSQTIIFNDLINVPTNSWQTFTTSFNVDNGIDVSGGVTLQITAICGAVDGCGATLNIDNVSITVVE
ncbi:MAG: PKD domain-containing protein [Bacteroidota bacterium]